MFMPVWILIATALGIVAFSALKTRRRVLPHFAHRRRPVR